MNYTLETPVTGYGPDVKLIGETARFTNAVGRTFDALITSVWGFDPEGNPTTVNLVVVSDNPDESDQYGRQIKRFTSVVCKARQDAHGMYFEITSGPSEITE